MKDMTVLNIHQNVTRNLVGVQRCRGVGRVGVNGCSWGRVGRWSSGCELVCVW